MLRQFMAIIGRKDAPTGHPKQTEATAWPMMVLRFLVYGVLSSADDHNTGPLLNGDLTDIADMDKTEEDADFATDEANSNQKTDPRLLARLCCR